MSFSDFTDRFNHFLYRQSIRKLGEGHLQIARDWTLDFIRREHPNLTEEQVQRYYENLLHLEVSAVDEWTRRMS